MKTGTPSLPYVRLPWLDADVPWIGIGTAEIDAMSCPEASLEEVLHAALRAGVSVIDTAPNYYDGAAEGHVGRAISRVPSVSKIYVLTKAGQLNNREMHERAERRIAPADQHWCFDRRFIKMSVLRSMRRLGRDQLDCVLLHNPEDAIGCGENAYDVLSEAVGVLERMCRDSMLRGWGIASWSGFFRPPGAAGSIQLMEFFQRLTRDYGTSHFVAIAFPMGLWNLDDFNAKCQLRRDGTQGQMSVLEASDVLGLTPMLNSPFCGGAILPDGSHAPGDLSPAQNALLEARGYAPSSLRIVGMRSYRSVQAASMLLGGATDVFKGL